MTEKLPTYPYEEHYEFPTTPTEQGNDELRFYKTPVELRQLLVVLRRMYGNTKCLDSMKEFAGHAGALNVCTGNEEKSDTFNFDFYSGTLMAVHINIASAPDYVKEHVLSADFAEFVRESPDPTMAVDNLVAHFEEWASGDEENWFTFLEDQEEEYQDMTMHISSKLYEDRTNAEQRQLDFLVGFTFATNLVWQHGITARTSIPI